MLDRPNSSIRIIKTLAASMKTESLSPGNEMALSYEIDHLMAYVERLEKKVLELQGDIEELQDQYLGQ